MLGIFLLEIIAPLCFITSLVTEWDFNIFSTIGIFLSLFIKARKDPLNASPAAVVSTTSPWWTLTVFMTSCLFLKIIESLYLIRIRFFLSFNISKTSFWFLKLNNSLTSSKDLKLISIFLLISWNNNCDAFLSLCNWDL